MRRGAGSLGCLFMLLIVAAVVYFGLPVGEAFFRFYRFEDEMKQSVRFARINPDSEIKQRLEAYADSIGMPPAARNVLVHRRGGRITVSTSYVEEFHLPGYVRVHIFEPFAEGTY